MHRKLSLRDLNLKGKKVLMRVDFNVPLDKNNQISDDSRLKASLPSIQYIIDQGASLILMSHLGRPKDKVVPELSLKPCAEKLAELLKHPVQMAGESVGNSVESLAKNLQPKEVLLLENLRFHPGEEHPEKEPDFANQLAKLGDIYISDAFGTAHREHASTYVVPKLFKEKAATGFLIEKELEFLDRSVKEPKRPFCAIIGGSKVSSKIGVIKSLLKKVDSLLIGGAMAYTFLKAKGYSIGDSLYEPEFLEEAKKLLTSENANKMYLPIDHRIAKKVDELSEMKAVSVKEGIPDGFIGIDIGNDTVKEFSKIIEKANTIFWNGPMGVFEIDRFAKGTNELAKKIAASEAITIVGGGDSIAAIQKIGLADKISHISTGGGASLEFIEFGTLPGIEALSEYDIKKGT